MGGVTNPKIVFIVVGTLAVMAITYMATLAWCIVHNLTPEGDLVRSFEAAGIYVFGAFTGILVNTRSHGPDDAPTKAQIVNPPSDPVNTAQIDP